MRDRYNHSRFTPQTPNTTPKTQLQAARSTRHDGDQSTLQYALIDLRVAVREFSSVVGTCPKRYARDIYQRWWDSRTSKTTILDGAVQHIEGLLSTASRSHGVILQIAGVGKQLAEADSACSRLRQVVRLLEDILCSALISRLEAEKLYQLERFAFQSP